jgi:hypothetical protein
LLGDANISLGDANILLGDANISLGDAYYILLGEANISLGDVYSWSGGHWHPRSQRTCRGCVVYVAACSAWCA